MKTTLRITIGLTTGFFLAVLFAATTTTSAAVSAAVPSASAKASSSAKPLRPPRPEPLASQSIPKEASSRPTLEEWKNATRVLPTRRSIEGHVCDAFRVREWLKVKCELTLAAIKQRGGNTDNVFFWIGAHNGFDWSIVNGGEVIFPLRPGDHRVIEFLRLAPEMCYGRQAYPWLIVDETWVDGDPNPTLVIR